MVASDRPGVVSEYAASGASHTVLAKSASESEAVDAPKAAVGRATAPVSTATGGCGQSDPAYESWRVRFRQDFEFMAFAWQLHAVQSFCTLQSCTHARRHSTLASLSILMRF